MMKPARNIRQKGVFLLPNALTTCALFAGFYSIIAGINGQYAASSIAIVVAAILDGIDGRVARMTHTQSEFGVQYDSLADMISFGLAPALLAFNWSLKSMSDLGPLGGKLGWLATFVFMACAALRLARFNAQAGQEDKSWFQGLASPAAAVSLAATIWFLVDKGVAGGAVRWLIWVLTIALGILMFSKVRYYSFKTFPLGEKVPLVWLFLLVLVIALLSLDPPSVLMVMGFAYVVSGLGLTLVGRRRRQAWRERRKSLRQQRREAEKLEEDGQSAEGGD